MSTNYNKKYLERLADVYIEKYDTLGYQEAIKWYKTFLNPELRKLVHPVIVEKVHAQRGNKKK